MNMLDSDVFRPQIRAVFQGQLTKIFPGLRL